MYAEKPNGLSLLRDCFHAFRYVRREALLTAVSLIVASFALSSCNLTDVMQKGDPSSSGTSSNSPSAQPETTAQPIATTPDAGKIAVIEIKHRVYWPWNQHLAAISNLRLNMVKNIIPLHTCEII